MKSSCIRNNNEIACVEADIEFNPLPNTGSGYIAVGTTCVDDDDDTNTTIQVATIPGNVEDESTTTTTTTATLYRSQCSMDDIPVVARGMTWKDAFYNHHHDTSDIIAVFDIDRTLFDKSTYEIFEWFIYTPIILASGGISFAFVFGVVEILMISVLVYYFFLWLIYHLVYMKRTEAKVRISCLHIAITKNRGIYMDEADAPDSFNTACRTIISYDEIRKCQVTSHYNHYLRAMQYRVNINTTDDHEIISKEDGKSHGLIPKYTIVGIQNQQKFVDIVNTMIEQQRHSTTTTRNNMAVNTNNTTTITDVEVPSVAYEVNGLI